MIITGTMIHYYFVCEKKLWYFLNGINLENYDENIKIGTLIDKYSYERENKNLMIDENINIDFIRDWKIIHEIKKSDKLEELFIWQVKYYIYILRKYGVNIESGLLDYPKQKKRTKVFLDEEDEEKLENIFKEIEKIKNQKNIPIVKYKNYCKKCAYYEFCYI